MALFNMAYHEMQQLAAGKVEGSEGEGQGLNGEEESSVVLSRWKQQAPLIQGCCRQKCYGRWGIT